MEGSVIYTNPFFTSQETHYVSDTKHNRLTLFEETVNVRTVRNADNTVWEEGISYLTGNTLRHRYRAQPVNAVWGNIRCLL
jgi:hypothetical protein